MDFYKQTWYYLKGFRLIMGLAILCALGHTMMTLLPALFVREVVGRVSETLGAGEAGGWALLAGWSMNAILIALAAIYTVRAVLHYGDRYLAHVAAWGMLARLRVRAYAHLQRLSSAYFTEAKSGELAPRIIHDIKTVEYFLAHGLPEGILSLLVPVGMTVVLMFINWQLALLMLLPVPLLLLVYLYALPTMRRGYRLIHDKMAEVNSLIVESIQGMNVIKAFNYEDERLREVARHSRQLERYVIDVNRVSTIPESAAQLLQGIGMLIVLGAGGTMAMQGTLALADLVVFIFYLNQFYQPIIQFAQTSENTQDAMAASDRVFELMSIEPDLQDAAEPQHPTIPTNQWDVVFDKVTFAYESGRPVLEQLNLHIRPGELVALVGHTGAGKTTVTRLVPRFWDVSGGALTVGGVDVRDWSLGELRRHVSIVLQDVFLFNTTVLDNILVGRPEATQAEAVAAARAANAHEFIEKLPQGYHTIIGEHGVKLSGGQKQRLSIARALLKDAPILILDEATSSVDPETEALIQAALARLMQGRTTIVVAHRLSTVERADRICVLAEGRLVEEGTHAQLLQSGGIYARLQRRQFSTVETGAHAPATP